MTIKLRKNDYLELRKAGVVAIDAKLSQLKEEIINTTVLKMKNELKNLKELKIMKSAVAKLKTIRAELKGEK